jgi:deoxyribodipyrimidine photo-lyase
MKKYKASSPMSRTLLWYRNDLRIHDHEALHTALKAKSIPIPHYCFDPRQFGQTPFGFPKTGAFRTQFLLESVADLQRSLRNLGSDLIVRSGYPEQVIPEIIKALKIDTVYWFEEVTSEECAVEIAIRRALEPLNVTIKTFWGSTLHHPDDLPFDLRKTPELFTQFRKLVEQDETIAPCFPTPQKLPLLPDVDRGKLPTLKDLGLEAPALEPRSVLSFRGGETAGLERLKGYIWEGDRLRSYKETRNGMLNTDDSSKLSPWLSLGCLSPRYVFEEVGRYETRRIKNDSTYWLIFELRWRDYFRFICSKHGNNIFKPGGMQKLNLPWKQDEKRFEQWCQGKTGFPLVDAAMRELATTGWMSNRGRQNVASFLTKNLGIDWRMGAEWFESLLIDYDVCSNWGNWNYTAGVGNDARGFRWFNITKQSKDYDFEGDYLRHWLPELSTLASGQIHEPWKLTQGDQSRMGIRLGVDYPNPVVDLFASARSNEQIYNQAAGISSGDRSGSKRPQKRQDRQSRHK